MLKDRNTALNLHGWMDGWMFAFVRRCCSAKAAKKADYILPQNDLVEI